MIQPLSNPSQPPERFRVLPYLVTVCIIWTILVSAFLAIEHLQLHKQTTEFAKTQADGVLERDWVFRHWLSRIGGVYAEIKGQVTPNPYLAHITDRDIRANDRSLTLINPAYMLRLIHEAELDEGKNYVHITSLDPLRPENAADPWEKEMLTRFETDPEMVVERADIKGLPYLRMMWPMVVETSCLKCHGHQGYRVGDNRGGTSVSVPLTPFIEAEKKNLGMLYGGGGALWMVGMAGILFAGQSMQRRIEKQHAAEEAFRHSEYRYRLLFENMTTAFALCEVIDETEEQPVDYRILTVNPAFEKLTGLHADRVVGRTGREVIVYDEERRIDDFVRVARGGEAMAFHSYSPTLKRYFENWAFSPRPNQFAVIFSDETERVEAAQERDALLQRIEQKNRDLEGILYVTSHDLRSPLVNIQGFGTRMRNHFERVLSLLTPDRFDDVVLEEVTTLLEQKVPTALGYVCSSAEKMDQLLTALLRVSRLERHEPSFSDVDMNHLLQDVCASMTFQLQQIEADVQIEPLPPCCGDPLQLNQLFSNLLDNALKYRSESRPLKIRVWGEEMNGNVVYHVSDNGIGISDDCRDKVWEIFYRIAPRGTVAGDGIGLTLVRRIIEKHRGQIRLESTLDVGTTFHLTLLAREKRATS